LALDPSGSLLYAVGSGTNFIGGDTLHSSTGALTTGQSSPLALQDRAYTIMIDPAGNFDCPVESRPYLLAYSLTNKALTTVRNYSGAL